MERVRFCWRGSRFAVPKLLLLATLALSGCNTTSRMEIPEIEKSAVKSVDKPKSEQALFALQKVVANIKRGTTIAHYPRGGVEGASGTLCNHRYSGEATMEWSRGSLTVGNWRSELGEIFYEVLSEYGLNIAGDPANLFDEGNSPSYAEYLIGARIIDVKGNFCHVHHWWDGRPMRQYSGEMYMEVEWTVYSTLLKRTVFKTKTEGEYIQREAKRDGVTLTFHNSFADAAEKLTGKEKFIDIALRRSGGGSTSAGKSSSGAAAGGLSGLRIAAKRLYRDSLKTNLSSVISAVVTIRVGYGHGSGFAIDENGMIMTNAHVVGDAKKVTVVLNNGLELQGEVLRRNRIRDVALVKVPVRIPSALPLKTALPSALDRVYVIGTPSMAVLQSSVTSGVVSAVREYGRPRQLMIQADAPISGGNSGGPLLDVHGNVIGITVLSVVKGGADALNMFIPIGSGLKALGIEKKRS